MFWPFTVWINCSSDLKKFENSCPSASKFQKFFSITKTIFSHSRSEQFWQQNTYHVLPPTSRIFCEVNIYVLSQVQYSYILDKNLSLILDIKERLCLDIFIIHTAEKLTKYCFPSFTFSKSFLLFLPFSLFVLLTILVKMRTQGNFYPALNDYF